MIQHLAQWDVDAITHGNSSGKGEGIHSKGDKGKDKSTRRDKCKSRRCKCRDGNSRHLVDGIVGGMNSMKLPSKLHGIQSDNLEHSS